jgi:hypothetical protein
MEADARQHSSGHHDLEAANLETTTGILIILEKGGRICNLCFPKKMRKKITYMIVEEATQPCFSDPN